MAGKRIIRSRTNFIRWLERLPRGTRFGRDCYSCPLATYSGHRVGFDTYSGGDEWLPEWAVQFVAKFLGIDGSGQIEDHLLTRGRALRVMRRLL